MRRFDKAHKLFIILGAFFITNALIAEFIGPKIFSVEKIFGMEPIKIKLFGVTIEGMNMSAGVLNWPIVFVMTDIINEYFGKRGVRFLSFLAVAMIAYAYFIVWIAQIVPPADFWMIKVLPSGEKVNLNTAFSVTFSQSMWIIVGSLTAFLIGQLVDVIAFHFIRRRTGEKMLWFRATGSTLVSQLIDSFVVVFIAFYIGSNWTLSQVFAVSVMNYTYKGIIAVFLTPLLYIIHFVVDSYLGQELAEQLITEAVENSKL